jgi:hypothetical protein
MVDHQRNSARGGVCTVSISKHGDSPATLGYSGVPSSAETRYPSGDESDTGNIGTAGTTDVEEIHGLLITEVHVEPEVKRCGAVS